MIIIKILDQLQDSYRKPNMMTLFNNDTLFRSPITPGDSPEMLFYQQLFPLQDMDKGV